MVDRPLDYRSLEVPAYDVVDMAMLLLDFVQNAVEEQCERELVPGYVAITKGQTDRLLFVSRLMVDKANAVKKAWETVDDAQQRQVRMTGGARNG